jgi:hypothetical protein
MPVVKKAVVTYTCDRCGFSSTDPFARDGYARVSAYGGYLRTYWLCGTCTEELRTFLTPPRGNQGCLT